MQKHGRIGIIFTVAAVMALSGCLSLSSKIPDPVPLASPAWANALVGKTVINKGTNKTLTVQSVHTQRSYEKHCILCSDFMGWMTFFEMPPYRTKRWVDTRFQFVSDEMKFEEAFSSRKDFTDEYIVKE